LGFDQSATAGVKKTRWLADDARDAGTVAMTAVVAEIRAIRMGGRRGLGGTRFQVGGEEFGFGAVQVVRRHMRGDILQLFVAIIEGHRGLEDQQCDQQIAGSNSIHADTDRF